MPLVVLLQLLVNLLAFSTVKYNKLVKVIICIHYMYYIFQIYLIEIFNVQMTEIIRGRPFDSEGGGLALFGNKYSDLENAGNK